jgi:PilZ domain
MEHRCGSRLPLNLEVAVRSSAFGEVRGQVRDISVGGMRLEADAGFSVYQPVTIEFSFPPRSPRQRWRAMVVHAANGSAGVMFEFLRAAELAKLIELLRAADDGRAAARSPSQRRHESARVEPLKGLEAVVSGEQ